jgi:hypothetical protein
MTIYCVSFVGRKPNKLFTAGWNEETSCYYRSLGCYLFLLHLFIYYRGISLLSSAYEIYDVYTTTIKKSKLQPKVEEILQEEQCGFRKGTSRTDAIFVIKQLIEKRREYNFLLFLFFLDYEKAYDRVDRCKLWNILTEYRLPLNLVNAIKSLYDSTSIIEDQDKAVGYPPYCLTYILTKY